jgi:serine/threonine protein kinase
MLSGTVPFKANNMDDLHKLITKGTFPKIKDISEEASDLLNGILEIDPRKRYTAEQILRHPFLNNSKTKSINLLIVVVLFTNAEIILLSKVNTNYRLAQKAELVENFSLRNLDTQKESENNMKTKSIILAPFSSSIRKQESFLEKEIKIENDVLRFVGKAIELNRNYELNNNGEIDNGVLINNSKKDEEKNKHINDSCPLSNNNSFKKYSKPTTPFELNENFNKKRLSKLPSPREDSSRLQSADTLTINDETVNVIEDLGYKRDYLVKCLINNDCNYATATYYLLMNSSK